MLAPRILTSYFLCTVVAILAITVFFPEKVTARNVLSFKNTLTDSDPSALSNHTFSFTLTDDIAAGGYLDIDFPANFEILSTSTFGIRNVELLVNGTPRTATGTLSGTTDQVILTTGVGGSVRYNLNTTTGLSNGDQIEFRVGNHTTNSAIASVTFSTSTGTTTTYADIGVQNASSTGKHDIAFTTGGSSDGVYADFVVFLIDNIEISDVDTTEIIPPFRFNGAPSGTLSGVSTIVELSLETDELAVCRYSTTASTTYAAMTNTFNNTGQLVHTQEITVANDTSYVFYVRCIDDEGNFNTDDYLISFTVPSEPDGTSDPDGDGSGDGNGDGSSGSGGSGSSGGGSSGSGSGSGGGSGGGGGGSGGGTGDDEGNDEPGGFDNGEPYESGDGEVIVNGYAYPGADVFVLVDGFIADDRTAGSDGSFSLTVEEIASGPYTFGVYAIDDNGVKSTTFSTTFSVQGSRTSSLSNVNLTPSVLVEPDPVAIGQTLTISGYSLPNAEITIENQKDGVSQSLKTFTATSDSGGQWSITVDTDGFSNGNNKVRAKGEQADGIETDFSDYTFYTVGEESNTINADLNRDGSVNLTDFSILLFWWGTDGGASDPPADINQDGTTSLTDFSILLFNWTG